MHENQQFFFDEMCKPFFPGCFKSVRILDVGSLDINGNNKYLFEDSEYIGVDVIHGKNVDVVGPCHEIDEPDESFDVIITTNALEHDIHWKKTLIKIWDLLKPGGFFICSAACQWDEHGTRNHSPENSGTTQLDGDWQDFYRNVNIEDFESVYKFKVNKDPGTRNKPKLRGPWYKSIHLKHDTDNRWKDWYGEMSYRDLRFIGVK
jgi:SAM-dependent methyltransferase